MGDYANSAADWVCADGAVNGHCWEKQAGEAVFRGRLMLGTLSNLPGLSEGVSSAACTAGEGRFLGTGSWGRLRPLGRASSAVILHYTRKPQPVPHTNPSVQAPAGERGGSRLQERQMFWDTLGCQLMARGWERLVLAHASL